MFAGSRRGHHLKAEASQKVTVRSARAARTDSKTVNAEGWILRIQKFRAGIDPWFWCADFLLNALYHTGPEKESMESRLQNGKVGYKAGISLTKQESHLQNGTLGLQTGLSACNLPTKLCRVPFFYVWARKITKPQHFIPKIGRMCYTVVWWIIVGCYWVLLGVIRYLVLVYKQQNTVV